MLLFHAVSGTTDLIGTVHKIQLVKASSLLPSTHWYYATTVMKNLYVFPATERVCFTFSNVQLLFLHEIN